MKLINDALKKQIASLESKLDVLESEISNLDEILKSSGFPEGIASLKSTMHELLKETEGEKDF